ncbi:MAG: hypothetical protein ISS74_04330 [Planctomycetes bacterium]|nr:hypothetical protein [Planctomycetota bacterium]
MPERKSPDELLDRILAADRRYARDAYIFVSEALGYTVQRAGRVGHVSGPELCEGMAEFALGQFGRLARAVLDSWGIRSSEDIGAIVFNMVEVGLLHKTDEDRREDFVDALDFDEAFDRGFELHLTRSDDDASDPEG